MDANHKGAGTYGLLAPHGKMYIGKSVRYKGRMQDHKKTAYSKKNGEWKENKLLYRALRKWGFDRFEKFIFQKHDETRADIDDVLNKQEIALIAEFETFNNRDKGYNLTAGGEGTSGRKMTPEQRVAHTARMKKQWEDPEYRAKASVALKEAHNRPEVKATHSAAMKKVWTDPEYRAKARWRDPEFKAKMSAALTDAHNRPDAKAAHSAASKKMWASEKGTKMKEAQSKLKSKPVVSKQLLSGKNPIKEYQLRYHASRTIGVEELGLLFGMNFSCAGISNVISGKRKHHRGFFFENYSGAPGQPTPENPKKKIRVAFI